MMKDFADYLKETRLNAGFTQTQFAARLYIDTAALSKIENGKKEFDPNKLDILSSEFNIELKELKSKYFGEKIALELYTYDCPIITFQVAEEKFRYLEENV